MSRKRKVKCIWLKDHDHKKKRKRYYKVTYAFGVCNVCRTEARKGMRMYKSPRPRKRRKLRVRKKK